jgi:PEP-CTERM motif
MMLNYCRETVANRGVADVTRFEQEVSHGLGRRRLGPVFRHVGPERRHRSDIYGRQRILNRLRSMSGVSTVPEPSTWALLLIGFAGLGIAGWRRGSRVTAA